MIEAGIPGLRGVRADNPGPFTLDGTRTWVVGAARPAVVDPGPDLEAHVAAVARLVGSPAEATVVLTHGHADHAAGLERLLVRLRDAGVATDVVGPADPRPVATDVGRLRAVPTPGHTDDHLAWHWEQERVVFVGDHLLGEGDTTWVAGYPGCVADYLESLERLRMLDARCLVPAHGPLLRDPSAALDRYEAHRRRRIEQVRKTLAENDDLDTDAVLDRVYGDAVPAGLRAAARESVEALVDHVRRGEAARG